MFDGFFENVPTAAFMLDGCGTIARANRAACALVGREEFAGVALSELFVGDVSELVGEEDVDGLTLNAVHADGASRTVEARTFDAGGARFVVLTDISERELVRRQLAHSQMINKTGTWSLDLETDAVWWSPELYRIFELPVTENAPPYETHHELFSAESWQRLQVAVSEALEGEPYELELELTRRDEGGPLIAVARCDPQVDERGEVVRLIGTFQDVTELARARRRNDAMLARLTIAKSLAGLGVWEWVLQTDELTWDERMYELYGVPAGRPVVYDDWRDAVHPDDLEGVERVLRDVVEGGGRFRYQFRVLVEGRVRHVLALASLSQVREHARPRMIGVNMDVTEQVRHQEELRRANNMESLGLLAGGIAHDFNNLLMGIIAHTELLRFTHDGVSEVMEVIDAIGQAVDSARALTQQLLTFSKGGAPIRRAVSLDELVREQVTFSLRGSTTRAEVVSDPDLWAADVDPGQMAQVVQNLVLNADQAMPPGGEIQVRLANKPPESPVDAPFVELRVTDTGHGMPEEVRQQVFLPYFSTKPDGHGLGLSICHSIVERHGGSIRVESVVGEGTTFIIELPASAQDIGEELSDPTTYQGEGRVLIVDDQDGVRRALMRLIRKLGFDTVGARDVDEAIHLARTEYGLRGSFDLVLTDLTMPGSRGGLDVVEGIKGIDPEACVVVLSGYADDPVLRDFRHHGFDAALNKPVSAKELSRVLHALIGVPKGA